MTKPFARSVDSLLVGLGTLLLMAVTALLVLLAALPGGGPVLANTVSAGAYGPHGRLVFAVLLIFGLAAGSLGAALGLRLAGTGGAACGMLIGVWATAAIVDAFVRTSSRAHTGTSFTQTHTMIAVAGVIAQVVAAIAYCDIVRRRLGFVPLQTCAATAVVLAGVVFFALHPDNLAGLSERALFVGSAVWMLHSVHVASARRRP